MKNFPFASRFEYCRPLFFVVLLLLVLVSCDHAEKNSLKAKEGLTKINVEAIFQQHFATLDSVLAGQYHDRRYPLERLQAAIDFMESLTGVPSKAEGTDIGRIEVKQDDVDNWKNWYDQNKQKLFWSEKEKRVVISKSEK